MELVMPVLTHVLTAAKISSTSIGCFSFICILRLIEYRRFGALSKRGTHELVWKDFPGKHSNFLHVPWNEKKWIYFTKQHKIQRVFQLSSSEKLLRMICFISSFWMKVNYFWNFFICILTLTKICSSKIQLYNFDLNIMYNVMWKCTLIKLENTYYFYLHSLKELMDISATVMNKLNTLGQNIYIIYHWTLESHRTMECYV